MTRSRHRWSPHAYRPDEHHTIRLCLNCGLKRVTRHEGDRHWLEFYDTEGMRIRIEGDRTPPCEPQEVVA